MTALIALYKKEVKAIFTSPLSYIITALFSLVMGWMFYNYLMISQHAHGSTVLNAIIIPTFGNINFLMLIIIPLLTMRSFAEEKKQGTLNLMFMAPIKNSVIILGKFLGVLTFTLFILSVTLVFPIVLASAGYTNWPVFVTSYIGIIFSIICYIGVGLFASSLTKNQIMAAFLSFCMLFSMVLLVLSIHATKNYLVGQIFQYMSIAFHYEGLARGMIKTYNIIYFLSFAGFTFYLTEKSLESRNW